MIEYTITIRNYPYRIRESGEGTPFIWLHGMFYSPAIEDIFAVFDFELLSRFSRLIRIELPCHGMSPLASDAGRLTWPSIAADIREIAASICPGNYFIGGFSQGAGISAHITVANPSVSGVVLAMLPRIWEQRPPLRRTYEKLAVKLIKDKTVLERLFRLTGYAPSDMGWKKEAAEKIYQLMLSLTSEAYRMILEGAIKSDMPDKQVLRNLEKPVMLLGWDGDPNHTLDTCSAVSKVKTPDDFFIMNNHLNVKPATFRLLSFIFTYF
jgi:pimeloyl-ACP methyl ester carboxylesterase